MKNAIRYRDFAKEERVAMGRFRALIAASLPPRIRDKFSLDVLDIVRAQDERDGYVARTVQKPLWLIIFDVLLIAGSIAFAIAFMLGVR